MIGVPSLWDITVGVSGEEASTPDQAQGVSMMDGVTRHCTGQRDRLAILDVPPGRNPDAAETFAGNLASPNTDDAAFTTLHYQRIKVPDVDGVEHTVPPRGHVAGVWARTDVNAASSRLPPTEPRLAAAPSHRSGARSAPTKIRAMRGPATCGLAEPWPFPLVSDVRGVYHQHTKNLLVSYSPKKLGFF